MIMGDLFCHLSFTLLLGAVYTLCLYVVYICINVAIVHIENKYSVYVHFKNEYMEYDRSTPAYLNLTRVRPKQPAGKSCVQSPQRC